MDRSVGRVGWGRPKCLVREMKYKSTTQINNKQLFVFIFCIFYTKGVDVWVDGYHELSYEFASLGLHKKNE